MKPEEEFDFAVYAPLLDQMFDAVYIVDRDRRILYWNPAAERLTGYASAEVVGRPCFDGLLCHVSACGQDLCQGQCPLSFTMIEGNSRQDEIFLHHRDGHRLPVRVRCSPLRNRDGDVVGGLEVFEALDGVSDMQARITELEEMALVDPLTGLANRRHAQSTLDRLLDEAQRYQTGFAVLLVDIDAFKCINDAWGHEVGDRVLTMVAGTLGHNLRPFDLVGRWGGDEFIAALRHVSRAEVVAIADRIRSLVASSFLDTERSRLSVTISIGATFMRQGDTRGSVVDRADRYLYASKEAGRNRLTVDEGAD